MRSQNSALGFTAALALSLLASQAGATPTLQMGITLLDPSNVALPNVGGVYAMAPGQSFRVMITATLISPNLSDAGHIDESTLNPLPVISLGIQKLTFDVVSSPSSTLAPFVTTAGPSGKWGLGISSSALAFVFALPLSPGRGINYPFVNITDDGGDGDLDPIGAGYENPLLTYKSLADLPGLQNGIDAQINVIRGGYTAGEAGGVLATRVTDANAYFDPAATDNELQSLAIGATAINASAIIIVPEPTVFVTTLTLLPASLVRRRCR